jgi:hypothetical protein
MHTTFYPIAFICADTASIAPVACLSDGTGDGIFGTFVIIGMAGLTSIAKKTSQGRFL